MTRFSALGALSLTAFLVGCSAPGLDLHARWAASGTWLHPPEPMLSDASDSAPDTQRTSTPSSIELSPPDANAETSLPQAPPSQGSAPPSPQRTYAQGPMVFGAASKIRYKLSALGSWLPLGSMEMEVRRFESKGSAFVVDLETRYTLAGVAKQEAWKAYLDSAWIQVDGKPMMPQTAEPGMAWPSINGHAYFIAWERVETDLGVFNNCWKVLYAEGAAEPTEYWFAPGLGLVKARFTLAGLRVEAQVVEVKA